ncbi:MAG: ATP-binding protein [Acidobacteriota bacterium]
MALSHKLRLAPLWPALAAGLVAVLLMWMLLPKLVAETSANRMLTFVRTLAPEVEKRFPAGEVALQRWIQGLISESELRITVVQADGRVLADSSRAIEEVSMMDNHAGRPEVVAAWRDGWGWSVRKSDTTGRSYIYVALAVSAAGDRPAYALRVAEPSVRLEGMRPRLLSILALATTAALLVIAVLSWWLSRHLFRPLERLIAGAEELARGHYDHRLEPPPGHDLGRLAHSLNRLAERVKEQIAAVAAERDHLRAILSSTSEGVMVVDGDGHIVLTNPAFQEIFGTSDEVIGRAPLEVVRVPAVAETLDEALAEGKSRIRQVELPPPRSRTVTLAADLLDTEAGGLVLAARDTTEAARLTLMRRDFVANVSHEIKTPLAAIRGYAETLRDGALEEPATAAHFLDRVLDQCHRLQALLDDLLVLSRLESVEVPFEMKPVLLASLVDRAVEVVSGLAEDRDIALAVHTFGSEHDSALFDGDAASLERVLVNLLGNAIKYNQPGGRVTLRYRATEAEIHIEIEDTGIGIPDPVLPRIFERFYRVDKGRSRDEGGTGLGLAIVKHVVQGHKGRLDVVSQVGVGTTFRVTLPRFSSDPSSGIAAP